MKRNLRMAVVAACAIVLLGPEPAESQRRKKKDEDFTQQLEVIPEPPSTLTAEPQRLTWFAAPLSAKGLLSQQTRDALKLVIAAAHGVRVVKIRAFVAGTGDLRRIQSIVGEEFGGRKIPLPVLSVVQVGGLPLEAAQVQIEAAFEDRKRVNPHGIAFISGQDTRVDDTRVPLAALAATSVTRLKTALESAGTAPDEMLRVTCFLTSLDAAAEIRGLATAAFPRAALTLVQSQRAPEHALVECEAVARLRKAPHAAVVPINPDGLPKSANYTQVVMINAPRLVFAGAQLAFRYSDDDARLAFQRLERTLSAAGSSLKNSVMLNVYPLSAQLAETVRKVRFEFLDKDRPPACTLLEFEGLPGMDASFSLEAVTLPLSQPQTAPPVTTPAKGTVPPQ